MIIDKKNTIKGWGFTEEEIISSLSSKSILLNPSIDLTNACNLNCPYCYIEEKNSLRKKRKTNELNIKETIQVIDEFKSLGAKTINIVGAGEPTIDEFFFDIIKYIYDNNMTTVLFTNGIKFASDNSYAEFCFHHDVSIVLKYNSQSKLTQDLVAGKKGYSIQRDKAMDTLINSGFNSTNPTRLGIDTIVFKGNLLEIPILHKWCRDFNIFPITTEYLPTGRTENGEFKGRESIKGFNPDEIKQIVSLLNNIDSSERKHLIETIKEIDVEYGIGRNCDFAYYGGGVCTQLLGLYVNIEGNIFPCVARSIKNEDQLQYGCLGNIRTKGSITDIWNNNDYIKVIKKEYNGGCPYKPQFKFI